MEKLSKGELILAVPRDKFFFDGEWQGLKQIDFKVYHEIILKWGRFLPRSSLENDPSWKQIIPYIIFRYKDKYFLMKRKGEIKEKRLKNKYSLGIGGHINPSDIISDFIFDWALREINEEVEVKTDFYIRPFGILNDDSDMVGKVHVGFVFILEAKTNKIKAKKIEHVKGSLVSLDECAKFLSQMENWSRIIFHALKRAN